MAGRQKQIAAGSIGLAAAILGIYRILTFTPRPLDSPGTLRPLLYALFNRFTRHYPDLDHAQQAWSTACLVLLFVPAVLALVNYFGTTGLPVWLDRAIRSRLLFCAGFAPPLILARFPAMLYDQINPDESLFLAAAHMLFRDAGFFRAVDCGTTGPFNIYPLLLPALFGLSPDYASARLIGVLLILAGAVIVYCALALLTDDAIARLAVLPAAVAFVCLKHDDFLSYGAEHVSFLLVSLAFYWAVKTLCKPEAHTRWLVCLGVLTAITFMARMQAVPIVVSAVVVAIAYVNRSQAVRWWRLSAVFLAAVAAPLLILGASYVIDGSWRNFWMEYILGNFRYVGSRWGAMTPEISRLTNMALFGVVEIRILLDTLLALLAAYAYQRWRAKSFLGITAVGGMTAVASDALIHAAGITTLSYVWMLALLTVPASFLLLWRKQEAKAMSWFGFLAGAVLGAAAMAVYAPHRLFEHYLLLLVLPLAICMAWPLVSGAKTEAFVLAFATLTLAGQVFQMGHQETLPFAGVPAGVRGPDGALIDALTTSTGAITVWGWNARPYLASGRRSATVDLDMYNMFLADPALCAYRRADYLRTMERHPPELFVDALDTGLKGFANREEHAFEVIPQVKAFVQSNYTHVMDAYSERFYIRRDLARSLAGLNGPRPCDAQAIRCFDASTGTIPAALAPLDMPEHALVEAAFTPEIPQDAHATVFSTDATGPDARGLVFEHVAGDRYRLAVGLGSQWAYSRELTLAQRRPAALAFEFHGRTVSISCNGKPCDQMQLPSVMPQSTGSLTIGVWVGYTRPFLGNIQFFQIRKIS